MTLTKDAPPQRRKFDWRTIVATLRANPGTWYRVNEPHPSVTAHGLRRGAPQSFSPPGSFDAIVKNAKTGSGVWIRFVGEPVTPWDFFMGDTRTFDELDRDPTNRDPTN